MTTSLRASSVAFQVALFCGFVAAFLILLMFLSTRPASALTCTFASAGNNDFSTSTNWSCGRIPTNGDDVFIPASTTTNLSAGPISVNSVTATGTLNLMSFALTATSTLSVPGGTVTSTGGSLTVTGAATSSGSIGSTSGTVLFSSTFQNNGTFEVGSGSATTTGAFTNVGTTRGNDGTLTFLGDFTNSGTFTAGAGTLRFAGGSDQSITGISINILRVDKSGGTATFVTSNASVGGTFTNDAGTLSAGSVNFSVTGATTVSAGVVSSTAGTLTFSGNATSSGSIGSNTGNILFSGTYQNNGTFILGSGSATTTGALTNVGTLFGGTGTFSVSSSWSNSGTFQPQTGTVKFVGQATQTVPGLVYNNVALRTTGADVTLSASSTFSGTTDVISGVTFAVATHTLTAVGLITNTGLITIGTGGKIIHTAESTKITDSAGTEITSATSSLYITVQDSNRNLNGGSVETMTTNLVTNAAAGSDSETPTLTETGPATGIFRSGSIPIYSVGNVVLGSNQLELLADGVGTMTYTDNQDAADTATDGVTLTRVSQTTSGTGTTTDTGGGAATNPSSSGSVTLLPVWPTIPPAGSLPFAPNTLLKLPDDGNALTQADSAVYYFGSDGMRHAFPNEKVYRTWFGDFSTVQIVSGNQLSLAPLGRNVTYRPGVRMVKFLTDPRVYVVTRGGELRWVKTEELARALYGDTWNRMIDDVNDAFYVNYRFGADVSSASDYIPATETAAATTINWDMGL